MSDNQDRKADAGKPNVMRGVFLKFPRAMEAIAQTSLLGSTKYEVEIDDKNYQGSSYRRYLDPVGRHLIAHETDPVSHEEGRGLPPEGMHTYHLASAAWSMLAALENYLIERENEGLSHPY